jgi:hypothetical protein
LSDADQFNEQTVEAVEQVIQAKINCDSNMKALFLDLAGGSRIFLKGWLRRSLRPILKCLRKNDITFRTRGCWVGTQANWRSADFFTDPWRLSAHT